MVRKVTIINYRTKVPLATKERNMRESNQGMQKNMYPNLPKKLYTCHIERVLKPA